MKVLVDTGATNSIILESSLSTIHHRPSYPVQQEFFLANGTSISISGYVNLEIKIQHIKTYVTAAIAKFLCCDVILGEDWIKRYQVNINRVNDSIEIMGNKAAIPLRPTANKQLVPVKLQDPNPTSLSLNVVSKDLKDTLSTSIDVEKTLDQAVQHITDRQEQIETRNVIARYHKVFNISTPTIALTPIYHTIPTGNHPPINSVPYRGSLQQQQALTQMIRKLEQSNQIRPSSSPWSSPVLLIKKKDGDYRFVVDYRKLNSITTKDSFPIPTIESTLQQLAGQCYFSKLDLRSGYFQIPIHENDKPKTAFIKTTGLWEFNVLPMGLTNAPPSFQRTMYNLIVNSREHYCLVYLDDIIIFSKTFRDHLKHLDEILRILNDHRFQLNPSKCSIMKQQITYLGHSINGQGISPLYDNIKAIRELHLPDHPTLKQANEFVGGISFYRKFIKNFSKIAAPLHRVTNLTKKNKHLFTWGDEQQQAAQRLKDIITGPDLVLDFPDPSLPFTLSTDASKIGLGAVLKQVTLDGRIKIIYYLSRVLSKSEAHYSTTELKALAMVWAITKLRPYLLGRDFQVETDHCPLCQFHKKQSRNGRLDRWSIEILAEYNITQIKYKKGKCHCDADLLSRYPLSEESNKTNNMIVRQQIEGYLFPHTGRTDDDNDFQPIATVNIMTRSAYYKQTSAAPVVSNDTTQNNSLAAGVTNSYSTRSNTRNLQSISTSLNSNSTATTEFMNSTKKLVEATSKANTNTPLLSSTDNTTSSYSTTPSHSILTAGLQETGFTMKELKNEQMKDEEILKILKSQANTKNHDIINGIVHKIVLRGKTQIKLPWIPKSMVKRLLFLYHDHPSAAHFGNNKTSSKLANKYYWPNMHHTISNYIRSCMKCSKHNYVRTKRPGKMNVLPIPNEVMGLVGMDYWGPTDNPTTRGNRYVITMTDYLSKFVFAKAVKTNSAQEAADFFLHVCYHYGPPAKLITDQGTHFVAELTSTIIQSCNTTHILTTPYHPTSNAQTERFNATFAPALSKLISDQSRDWDDFLQPVIYAYNTSQHATTT